MRRWIVPVLVAAALLVAAGWFALPRVLAPTPAPTPPAPVATPAGSVSGSPVALSAADRVWAAGFRERVAAAEATSRDLVRMGDEKSRNLFAIRAAHGKMGGELDAADAYLQAQPPPPALAGPVADYRAGGALVRSAMADAMAGFVRFDWDKVRAATGEMRAGQASLAQAVAALDAVAGATPVAGS